ncbi:MAG: MinD/ParA family protein [Desulfitobacterium hafniense]|nr:MinD/ParA family protein [Desulfitobacterium hafniense]
MPDQATGLREMAYRNREPRSSMRVISVTSGKGGVGKTGFTVNLALALVDYGYRVIIMDGDLGLANVDVACGITPRYTMQHMLAGEKTIEEILVSGPKGIGILPGGSGVQELANLDRPRLQNVIRNLGRLENMADLLIIDTGAGLSETVLNFLRASDDIILVTTPEPTSLTDAYGLLKTLKAGSREVQVNVVVNRVRLESDARAAFERLQTAVSKFLHGSLSLLGWIYDDPLVSRSVMNQEPLGISYPQSSANKCIQWIAGSVAGLCLRPPRQSSGVRGFLSSLLRTL